MTQTEPSGAAGVLRRPLRQPSAAEHCALLLAGWSTTGTRTVALSASTVAAIELFGRVPTAAEVRAALAAWRRRDAQTDLAAARVDARIDARLGLR